MRNLLGKHAAPHIDTAPLPSGVSPEAAALIARLQQQVQSQAREIAWRDAKLDKLNFELARLKRWKFGAKTEAMTAQQRALFQDTLAEDEASLQAHLAELQRGLPETPKTPKAPPRQPRRQALPEHLERVEHRHEPDSTTCPNTDCAQPMQRASQPSAGRTAAASLAAVAVVSRWSGWTLTAKAAACLRAFREPHATLPRFGPKFLLDACRQSAEFRLNPASRQREQIGSENLRGGAGPAARSNCASKSGCSVEPGSRSN